VIAEYDEGTNATQALVIQLIKVFNKEKTFDFSQMLTIYATCIPSEWEIFVNGHWFPVNMGFTSGVLNGRVHPESDTICNSQRPEINMLYKRTQLQKWITVHR